MLTVAACEVNIYLNDPEQAGNTAADFLKEFLINKDADQAYIYLHQEFKEILPKESMGKMIEITKSVPDILGVEAVSYVEDAENSGQISVNLVARRADGVNAFISISLSGQSEPRGYQVIRIKTLDDVHTISELPGKTYGDLNIEIKRNI